MYNTVIIKWNFSLTRRNIRTKFNHLTFKECFSKNNQKGIWKFFLHARAQCELLAYTLSLFHKFSLTLDLVTNKYFLRSKHNNFRFKNLQIFIQLKNHFWKLIILMNFIFKLPVMKIVCESRVHLKIIECREKFPR